MKGAEHIPSVHFQEDVKACQASSVNDVNAGIPVKLLVLDYDGTLTSSKVDRVQSKVPERTCALLHRMGKSISIAIITAKDLLFVIPRTPFAHAWSGVNGLEAKINGKILRKKGYLRRLKRVSSALQYARSRLTGYAIDIEEKHDMNGRTIAFCVDWRRVPDIEETMKKKDAVVRYCEELGLEVTGYSLQPFFDVYPFPVNKGTALREMLGELKSKNGVLYLGDSEADNPAFALSDVSLGVIHEGDRPEELTCDYLVRFEDISSFLDRLSANHFFFDPKFPMIRRNFVR